MNGHLQASSLNAVMPNDNVQGRCGGDADCRYAISATTRPIKFPAFN